MAQTTYIVDGLIEALINYINPSEIADNPIDGLKEKEDAINEITPDYLRELLDDYDELEELVAGTLKSNYTSLLLDRLNTSDIENVLPDIEVMEICPAYGSSSSSSSSCGPIHAGGENFTVVSLSGGNMDLTLFDTYEWSVVLSPEGSTVDFDDGWEEVSSTERDKGFFISFSTPGSYILSVRVTYEKINAYVQATVSAEVI